MSACDCTSAYPDNAWHGAAEVIENVEIATDTYRIRVACPHLAARVLPGQFVMLRLSGTDDPLLGRPLAVYESVLDDAGRPHALDVVYLVVGKMTGRLAHVRTGDCIRVWGPLGNGFPAQTVDHLIMVGGWDWPDSVPHAWPGSSGKTVLWHQRPAVRLGKTSDLVLRGSNGTASGGCPGFSVCRNRSSDRDGRRFNRPSRSCDRADRTAG